MHDSEIEKEEWTKGLHELAYYEDVHTATVHQRNNASVKPHFVLELCSLKQVLSRQLM